MNSVGLYTPTLKFSRTLFTEYYLPLFATGDVDSGPLISRQSVEESDYDLYVDVMINWMGTFYKDGNTLRVTMDVDDVPTTLYERTITLLGFDATPTDIHRKELYLSGVKTLSNLRVTVDAGPTLSRFHVAVYADVYHMVSHRQPTQSTTLPY